MHAIIVAVIIVVLCVHKAVANLAQHFLFMEQKIYFKNEQAAAVSIFRSKI